MQVQGKIKEFCDEQWEFSKATAERDGHVEPKLFIFRTDKGPVELPLEEPLSQGVPLMALFEKAMNVISKSEKLPATIIISESLIIREQHMTEEMKKVTDVAELEKIFPKGLVQMVGYSHGNLYMRDAEATDMGGHTMYEGKSEFKLVKGDKNWATL